MALTIGVEEEYQIVDAKTRDLKPRGSHILHALSGAAEEQTSNELFLSQIEIGTPVCSTLSQVREQIIRLRRAVIEEAEKGGDKILAASTHPFAHWQDQELTPKSRYLDMGDFYQQLAREHLICGCHVHVGIGDREMAIQIMNRARGWLSPLIALTANSPFWIGDDTGYASYRTEIWRRWPMAGSPMPFASRAEYDALVRTLVATGAISDETKIYWDMRPADRFETLEFRVTDVCVSVDDAVMIAGLSRALAQTGADETREDATRNSVSVAPRPELLRAAEWRAARFGLSENLIDVHSGEVVEARVLIERLLEHLRAALERAGDWDEVSESVSRVLARGNGAMRQREAFERRGDLNDVVDFLAKETRRGVV